MVDNEKKYRKSIGNKIKLARSNSNYTQEALAEKAGLSTRYISQIERGLAFGSANTVVSLCKALKVDSNFLFDDLIHNNESFSIDNLIDVNFLQSYIKLNDMNKQFVDLIIDQLLKLQDDQNNKKAN